MLTRRGFISTGLGSALAAPAIATAASAPPIVMVGAGLAGLAAACRLSAAGRPVVVLEASGRAGGRVRTERRAFPGLHAEAGAARFADTHDSVMRAVAEFGLALMPFTLDGGSLIVRGGQALTASEATQRSRTDPGLLERERGLSAAALLALYTQDAAHGLTDENPNAAAYARWAEYDALTWPNWLRAQGASEAALARMTVGADSDALSALYVLRQIALHRQTQSYYRLRDGMDGLVRPFVKALGHRIRYRAPVDRIERDGNGARVVYAGGRRAVDASRVVLAIPLTTLRQIDIVPALSAAKARAISSIGAYPAVRFLLQARRRFWTGPDPVSARTDRPAEIWMVTAGRHGIGPVFAVTIGGALGWQVAGMTEAEALRLGVAVLDEALPGFAGAFHSGKVWRWPLQPWARGAFAAFAPGQMTALMPALVQPEGVLHFAGEHTSSFTSWMEGALRSGERVAAEILAG